MNTEAVRILLEEIPDLIKWIREMPHYYETTDQIFVHAGIDEEAQEDWKWGTADDFFLWKYPATFGPFLKDIIAGHTGTAALAGNDSFHDIYYDGENHYFIDGSVYKGGKLLLLAYEKESGKYYQVEDGQMMPVVKSR